MNVRIVWLNGLDWIDGCWTCICDGYALRWLSVETNVYPGIDVYTGVGHPGLQTCNRRRFWDATLVMVMTCEYRCIDGMMAIHFIRILVLECISFASWHWHWPWHWHCIGCSYTLNILWCIGWMTCKTTCMRWLFLLLWFVVITGGSFWATTTNSPT